VCACFEDVVQVCVEALPRACPGAPVDDGPWLQLVAAATRTLANISLFGSGLLSAPATPTLVGFVVDALMAMGATAPTGRETGQSVAVVNFKCDLLRLTVPHVVFVLSLSSSWRSFVVTPTACVQANCSAHDGFKTDFGRRGGVHCVMNQCNLDERNPYLKEWAILALRNLTCDHPANQYIISQLKAQGVPLRLLSLLCVQK
jgi:hypothetical protein